MEHPAHAEVDDLLAKLKEAEELLQFPAVSGHVERASRLFLRIARCAPTAWARTAAMTAIRLAGLPRNGSPLNNDSENLGYQIRHLREELERARSRSLAASATREHHAGKD
jgi:hypothetical protein